MRDQYQLTEIRDLFADPAAFDGKKITAGGWIRNNRDSKAIGFIVLNDGTCFKTLQVVYSKELENFAAVAKLNVGSAILATGTIVATPGAKQPFEMQAEKIEIEGASSSDYPLQKKRHSFEYLRTIPHLRVRANTFTAVFRVRSLIAIFRRRPTISIEFPFSRTVSSSSHRRQVFSYLWSQKVQPQESSQHL